MLPVTLFQCRIGTELSRIGIGLLLLRLQRLGGGASAAMPRPAIIDAATPASRIVEKMRLFINHRSLLDHRVGEEAEPDRMWWVCRISQDRTGKNLPLPPLNFAARTSHGARSVPGGFS